MSKSYICLFVVSMFFVSLLVNKSILADETVSMVKDMKGDVWLIKAGDKNEVRVSPMMELAKGDKIRVGKNSGATILYYYSEIEEMYMDDCLVEIGETKGIVHKGKAKPVKDAGTNTFIKIETELPMSLRSQEDFGAFTLRGNPPPTAAKYFDESNMQRYAVIIGISKFKDKNIPPLKYADRDAQSFYDFLISPTGGSFNSDNVLLMKNEDATLKNVKDGLTNFLKRAIDDDFVIVYIASHGEPEPDRPQNLFLLTHDSELDKLASTAYHMENVNLDMKRYISADRLIFLADACHAGGIASGGFGARGFTNPINSALSALSTTKEGWAMITASRAGEVSLESDKWGNGHGAFTYALLEGLNGKADIAGNYNGIVTIAEAFDYLESKVKRETQSAQHPVITGDFDNSMPLGFVPVVAKANVKGNVSSDDSVKPVNIGVLNINSKEDNANIFINNKFIGKTKANEEFAQQVTAGTVKLDIKKKGYDDYSKTVFVNPDETSNVYVAFRSLGGGKVAEAVKDRVETKKKSGDLQYIEPEIDKAGLRDSISSLVKELEEMKMKQVASEGVAARPGREIEKRPERLIQPVGVPISIKRFAVNMKALSSQRDMDVLRMRVIDELIKEEKISIVERDLEYQEEILREQRLGGSILADRLYRVEIGRILGAEFICFSRVLPAYDSDKFILRMEIVDTATTRIDTIEFTFKPEDVSVANAKNIASLIREKIAGKRKF